ncbi:hypothetical protein P8935_11620 [Telmatobacter sp. DSM 110680]|uniref:Uncharacterized protein n=1 Tax=Telmatobacter sp. DSM 110680 TaxID=3036704 RepID=A0AAU7DP62_9BACT
MDDLREFALQLLEIEKRFLLEGKEEYCTAVVVVVTPEQSYSEEVEFENEEEKIDAYAAIVDRAKENDASAIITINTSFVRSDAVSDFRWGDVEHSGAPRAITLTISGPSLEPVSLSLPFNIEDGTVNIGEMSDFEPAVVGLLPGWP